MKRTATTLTLLATALLASSAFAQPVRNGVDVLWARDVEGAQMTLDGVLDEAAWQQAETIRLVWGNPPGGLPGSGQRIEGNPVPAEPPDPNDGTLYLLRDGNVVWMGLMVNDASVGGGTGLWNFDGIIMAILDRTARDRINYDDANNFIRPQEFILSWWNPADTTDADDTYDDGTLIGSGHTIPGSPIRGFGDYGVGFNQGLNGDARSEEDKAIWDFAATVDGIANDDTHGADNGYVIETFIDFGALGYDFSQEGGDRIPFNIALQDQDYSWPTDPDMTFLSRVWFQNQWANNFNEGVGYIMGRSDVTVSSGEAPAVTEPEFTVMRAPTAPTLDGVLDEPAWVGAPNLFHLQYKATPEVLDMNPGTVAPYYTRWFRPDINGDGNAAVVVDPSLAKVKLLFEGNTLYAGVDVADQAISGIQGESGRDGIRITLRWLDSLTTAQTLAARQFDFSIDSTGAIVYGNDALGLQEEAPGAVMAAVGLKGSSTVADPTDVDEGYQMEIAINLVEALGYPDGLGEGRIWLALNFFDGDFLETQEASYATRTWISGERNTGASLYGYLDPAMTVSVDDAAEVPRSLKLLGNYPNPFNPSTTIRYMLPQSADVTIQVFDLLGREVARLTPGVQGAGRNEVTFAADGLASGLYLYRVSMKDATSGVRQATATGRMLLLK